MVSKGKKKDDEWQSLQLENERLNRQFDEMGAFSDSDSENIEALFTSAVQEDSSEDAQSDPEETLPKKETKLELNPSRPEQLKKVIERLESQNVEAKHWSMSGEVNAAQRPEQSLLDTHLEFQQGRFGPPVITDEMNGAIEKMVLGRVKAGHFDDVERCEAMKKDEENNQTFFRLPTVLESTQSKAGLAELYNNDENESEKKGETKKNFLMDEFEKVMRKLTKLAGTFDLTNTNVDVVHVGSFGEQKKTIEEAHILNVNSIEVKAEKVDKASFVSKSELSKSEKNKLLKRSKKVFGKNMKKKPGKKQTKKIKSDKIVFSKNDAENAKANFFKQLDQIKK